MWTCFSGLAYLLGALEGEAIPRLRAIQMVSLSPAQRMSEVAASTRSTRAMVSKLLCLFGDFLDLTSEPATNVVPRLENPVVWKQFEDASEEFGKTMHQLVSHLTDSTVVERFLLI
jgi:hypothetical protein